MLGAEPTTPRRKGSHTTSEPKSQEHLSPILVVGLASQNDVLCSTNRDKGHFTTSFEIAETLIGSLEITVNFMSET